MKSQAHMPAHVPVTKTMLSNSQRSERINYMRQHKASLNQMPANTVHQQSLVQTDTIEGVEPAAEEPTTTLTANTVGDNFVMGSNPDY